MLEGLVVISLSTFSCLGTLKGLKDYIYSHLSNKRGGDAKVRKSINVEVGILQLESSPFVFK